MSKKYRNSARPLPGNTQQGMFWQSSLNKSLSFQAYYTRLVELSVSMFKWTGLPDSVDPRFLELALFTDGMAVFFNDPNLAKEKGENNYMALRCMIGGTWDAYNIPKLRKAYASNGYNISLDENNSVIIFNNMIHTNSIRDVEQFADKLSELDETIRVNVKAQKTPVLILCDETQRLTMKNLYMQYDGNMPYIFGDKQLNPNGIKAISTGAPYVADKLYEMKTQYWNEALTYLGISSVNVMKKERLISDEVMRNLGGTIASRYSRLESRRQACEKINDMFGLNIWCEYREDFREADDEVMLTGDTGDNTMANMAINLRTQ